MIGLISIDVAIDIFGLTRSEFLNWPLTVKLILILLIMNFAVVTIAWIRGRIEGSRKRLVITAGVLVITSGLLLLEASTNPVPLFLLKIPNSTITNESDQLLRFHRSHTSCHTFQAFRMKFFPSPYRRCIQVIANSTTTVTYSLLSDPTSRLIFQNGAPESGVYMSDTCVKHLGGPLWASVDINQTSTHCLPGFRFIEAP